MGEMGVWVEKSNTCSGTRGGAPSAGPSAGASAVPSAGASASSARNCTSESAWSLCHDGISRGTGGALNPVPRAGTAGSSGSRILVLVSGTAPP